MEEVYKALLNYYKVLPLTGYISIATVNKLLALAYIQELVEDPDFLLFATKEQQAKACNLYKCVTQNNCLL